MATDTHDGTIKNSCRDQSGRSSPDVGRPICGRPSVWPVAGFLVGDTYQTFLTISILKMTPTHSAT